MMLAADRTAMCRESFRTAPSMIRPPATSGLRSIRSPLSRISDAMHTPELPVLLADIPAKVEGWLRQAGLPVVPFRPAVAAQDVRWEPGRLLLFDSRGAVSRASASLAKSCGMTTLDMAGLEADRTGLFAAATPFRRRARKRAGRLVRMRFLDRLKRRVEAGGGTWARLADFPFPFRSAVCRGEEFESIRTAGFGRCLETVSNDHSAALVRDHYIQGRPLFLHDADEEPAAEAVIDPQQFPLLWSTTPEAFSAWWLFRQSLHVRVRRRRRGYRIECDGDCDRFQPMLEIWRGTHLASIPLSAREMDVEENGLAFRREPHRHPAGFTALWSDGCGDLLDEPRDVYEPQPA